MTTQWTKLAGGDASIDRYKATNRRANAWIERHADGSADAGAKNGFLNLGLHTESHFFAPAPADEVILAKLDHSAEPPRFDQWGKDGKPSLGTTHYKGKADNLFNSTVKATIVRVGDEAEVQAKVGLFGTEIEGHFFAPAPSDTEILKRISQRP